MNRPAKIPSLRIGSAAALGVDVSLVCVRSDDRPHFKGVIEAREALIDRRIERFLSLALPASETLSEEVMNLAIDAHIDVVNNHRNEARQRLELAAAMAIAALSALKGESQ